VTTLPHNGTAPSIEAARYAANKVAEDRKAILRALHAVYPDGLTDQAIQDATGIEESSERPRRGKLHEDGLIEKMQERRPTRSGVGAWVWMLTAKARNAMNETP
jgi:transcription initiation factor IIE alpha subunit